MVLILLKALWSICIQTTVFIVANRSLSLDAVTVFSYTLYFMYNSSALVASMAYKVLEVWIIYELISRIIVLFKKAPFSTPLLDNLASTSPGPAEYNRESTDESLICFVWSINPFPIKGKDYACHMSCTHLIFKCSTGPALSRCYSAARENTPVGGPRISLAGGRARGGGRRYPARDKTKAERSRNILHWDNDHFTLNGPLKKGCQRVN